MRAAVVDDGHYMARALELAERGLNTTDPNPRVGCVLVRDGRVIGEGWHRRAGEAHAEIEALRAANFAARGSTAYVTLEPCSHTGRTPPCAEALIEAGVARVVSAVADPNPLVAGAGILRLRAAGVDVAVGLRAEDARALNAGFFSRFTRGRPYVRLKMAVSLDARSAHADGRKEWISGAASRADVQAWRARSSAVLTGAGTVRIDDPRLDVRLDYGPWVRQPLRAVIDSALTSPANSRVFQGAGALVFAAPDARPPPLPDAVLIERVPRAGRGLDLHAILERLAAFEVNELLVECGPRLAGAFLEARLVDEMILYVAPILLGADAPPLALLQGADAEPALKNFELADVRRIGEDVRLILRPKGAF